MASSSPANLLRCRREPVKAADRPTAAKPGGGTAEVKQASAATESREAVAADTELFLHQVDGAGSRPLGRARWLQRTGLNICKASDAQHVEAITLAQAANIRISGKLLRATIMAEVETLSGRKDSRTTRDVHMLAAHARRASRT
jgi:hypothetical protein